jgi:hypothetical protein
MVQRGEYGEKGGRKASLCGMVNEGRRKDHLRDEKLKGGREMERN